MANLLKQTFKILILLFAFLLFTCENEDDALINKTNKQYSKSPYDVKKIDFDEISRNSKLNNQINEIQSTSSTIQNETSAESKLVFLPQYNFYVDTDEAVYVENNTYHSYTFPIYLNNSTENYFVYNLLFSYNINNNDYDVFVITYDLNKTEREAIDNGTYVSFEGKSSIEYLEDFETGIVLNPLMIFIDEVTGEAFCVDVVDYGPQSDVIISVTTYEEVPCPWNTPISGGGSISTSTTSSGGDTNGIPTGYSPNSTGTNWNTGNNNPNPNGGNESNTNNNPTTSSNIPSLQLQRKKTFRKIQLTPEENQSFSNLPVETQNSIFDYLESQLGANDLNSSLTEYSQESVNVIKWVIEVESLPNTPCGLTHDCIQSIQTMADGLRAFHGQEGVLMADYFESVINDSESFETMGDLQVFYDTAKIITKEYNRHMFLAITGAFVEGITPIVTIALFEVGLPVAIKLLQKIPLSWVLQGTRLNDVIQKVGLLGVQGSNNSIRIVTTNGSPISKARELFLAISRNYSTTVTTANGTVIVRTMANGSTITYRTVSGSGFPATIELNFPQIWSSIRIIKFQ